MKSWYRQGIAMALFSLLITLSAPVYAQQGGGSLPPEMFGREWQLVEIERPGQATVDTRGKGITINFNRDGSAGGNSTCNLYSAPFEAPGGAALRFGDVISTLRACVDQALNDLEALYYSLLKEANAYALSGDTLELNLNGGGVLRYTSGGAGDGGNVPGMPRTGGVGTDLMPFVMVLSVILLVAGAFGVAQARQTR